MGVYRLAPLKLRDWATSSEGEAAATQLISVLVTEHLSAPGRVSVGPGRVFVGYDEQSALRILFADGLMVLQKSVNLEVGMQGCVQQMAVSCKAFTLAFVCHFVLLHF